MRKIAVFAAGLACLFLPVAEAVPITSGFAEITMTDPVEGFGIVRFSFSGPGFFFRGGGGTSALVPCSALGPCVPGTTRGESGHIAGEDRGLGGTLTFGGETFPWAALPGMSPDANISFSHTFAIPMVGVDPPETLILTAPFKSSAFFLAGPFDPGWNGPPVALSMKGQGIVTVQLQLLGGAPETLYRFQSSRYEYSAIPEPGTGTLILPALAGLCYFWLRWGAHSL